MHDVDSNALKLLFMKEIHACSASVHNYHVDILYCIHGSALCFVINVLGTWQVHIVDYYSLLLSVLCYIAPGVPNTICYCVKSILSNLTIII